MRNIIHDYRLNMYTLLVSEYEEFVLRALEHNYIRHIYTSSKNKHKNPVGKHILYIYRAPLTNNTCNGLRAFRSFSTPLKTHFCVNNQCWSESSVMIWQRVFLSTCSFSPGHSCDLIAMHCNHAIYDRHGVHAYDLSVCAPHTYHTKLRMRSAPVDSET